MRVDDVQNHLESIYDLRCAARAQDFLVDAQVAAQLGATGRTDEELLVLEESGDLELALYLAPHLLSDLEHFGEYDESLGSYCQVAEGVSHFMYMVRTAHEARSVSLLELEAQAEVDKFATCLLHRWRADGAPSWSRELHHRLFERVGFRPGLAPAELWRYREANRLARNYCLRLLPHVKEKRLDRLLATLRYTYRLGAEAKLQHLAQAS